MKIAVLGCTGVIGQHMMISVPAGVEPVYVCRRPFPLAHSLDLEDWQRARAWLDEQKPVAIVNLAGESRVDVVEADRERYAWINARLPHELGQWADEHGSHVVHVSSQAVYDGTRAPYAVGSAMGEAVNAYGRQKRFGDEALSICKNWTIVRPTFVLGVRVFPGLGRKNPVESFLDGSADIEQVSDRTFSVSFAWDVAHALWYAAQKQPGGVHLIGLPDELTRFELARINPYVAWRAVGHQDYAANRSFRIAQRPKDTTYRGDTPVLGTNLTPLVAGLMRLRSDSLEIERMAFQIAAFKSMPEHVALGRLALGFGTLHQAVSADFRAANPRTEEELLNWYRTTEAYIWELAAYHTDPGFNYEGICNGIIERLKVAGAKRVLNLGDGIGTLTIQMKDAGLVAVYHDLARSRIADFAAARFYMRFGETMASVKTLGWTPPDDGGYAQLDAITALDFLEHVPNVEGWVRAVFAALRPGGLFVAQNAFGIGSGPEGAMPMHLAVNDRWERDWDPLLAQVGFVQEGPQWYRKPL